VQHALYGLIESETKTLMLASARMDYAFTVIDPAVPPERKYSPRRSLIVLGGMLAGLAIGMMVAYFRSALARLRMSSAT
jgi:LPS O-antigen subunit length determinant protein (WzzB/FepE family)